LKKPGNGKNRGLKKPEKIIETWGYYEVTHSAPVVQEQVADGVFSRRETLIEDAHRACRAPDNMNHGLLEMGPRLAEPG
jgi:hypothetical protein